MNLYFGPKEPKGEESNWFQTNPGEGFFVTWKIVRTFPHGHVAAVLGTLRNVGLERVLASRGCRQRNVVIAMVVARILAPTPKLATARCLREETATSSLALEMGLEEVEDNELYQALDWLVKRQTRIECRWRPSIDRWTTGWTCPNIDPFLERSVVHQASPATG